MSKLPFRLAGIALLLTTAMLAPLSPASADANEAADPAIQPVAGVVAAGLEHTCAVLTGGSVKCWGAGSYGRLGYGNEDTIGDDETPADVGTVPLGGNAVAITAGDFHTCALLESGAVRCWGMGATGRLGYGNEDTIGDDETPASVGDVPLGGTAKSISAGGSHTCALMTDGAVRCWGARFHGQLGYGNPYAYPFAEHKTPAESGDVPLSAPVKAVSTGALHTCVILETGGVRCWGAGAGGRLGYGNEDTLGGDASTLPSLIGDVPLTGPATAISAGDQHTCALLAGDDVQCWGAGASGRLGYGNEDNVGDDETPMAVGAVQWTSDSDLEPVSVSTGSFSTCVTGRPATGAPSVVCWGSGANGELGNRSNQIVGDDETPAEADAEADVISLPDTVIATTSGGRHSCAVTSQWALRCWGLGTGGRLGYGSVDSVGVSQTPADVGDVPLGAALAQPVQNLTRPEITGIPAEGQTLTASAGTWDPTPDAIEYQWYADDVAIPGATSDQLLLTSNEARAQITVKVVVEVSGYPGGSAVSDPVGPVIAGCTVTGTDGGETLTATQNGDVVCAEGGDDTIVIPDGITDVEIRGGSGVDTVDLSNLSQGVEVDLAAGTVIASGFAAWVAEVENVIGTPYGDTLLGSPAANLLRGGGGDDTIRGRAGADRLFGDGGNDTLHGDGGDDIVRGGPGNDLARGGAGADKVYGDAGDDQVFGDGGNDSARGGPGNDTVRGGAGHDKVFGDKGNDRVYGEGGNDRLYGAAGNDSLNGGAGNDFGNGGQGRDTASGVEQLLLVP